MKILLLGNSELARNFINQYSDYYSITIANYFDITDKFQCENQLDIMLDYDAVVITVGKNTGDVWDIITTNMTGPCFIISQLVNMNYSGHIIYIGSYGSVHTSWPDINLERLTYNISKLGSVKFIQGLEHSKLCNARLTVINPSKFKTKMSNYQGMEASSVSHILKLVIESPSDINITNLEFTKK